MGEVGEHGGVPGDAQDPVELQRVGRGLDHRHRVAGACHRRERRLQLGRPGRGHVRGVPVPELADLGLDRPDQAGREARRLHGGDGEERGRGLAVRAGDPDRAQRPRRVAVPPACGPGERGPRGTDDELRQVEAADRMLDDRRRGAGRGGRGDVLVAVDVEAGQRGEQGALVDRAGVVGDAPDLDVAQARPRRSAGRHGGRRARGRRRAGVRSGRRAGEVRPVPRRRGARREPATPQARSRPLPPADHAGCTRRGAAGGVPPAAGDVLLGAGHLDPGGPERPLVLVQAVGRLARKRLAVGAGRRRPRRGPSRTDPPRGRARSRASGAGASRPGARAAAPPGPRSGPSTGAARGGTGRGRRARRRPRRPRAPRGRRGGPRPGRVSTTRRTPRARRTRTPAARRWPAGARRTGPRPRRAPRSPPRTPRGRRRRERRPSGAR